MAMTKCKECKKEVSNSAKTCPHCGVKNPGTSAKDVALGLVVLAAIGWGVFAYMGGDGAPEAEAAASSSVASASSTAESDAACEQDLSCWAEKHAIAAEVRCEGAIEKLGQYSSKWTDGVLESKFSRFQWLERDKGYVTYFGDKIQFQNGFGAMQNHIYACDFDPKEKVVLGARAEPGVFK